MTAREVLLEGSSPWGFRMHGGADAGHPLRISRVNPGSKAAQRGVREGDVISAINGQPTRCLSNGDSHALLRSVGGTLRLALNQDASESPRKRGKEPLKREVSSGSTQSTWSTPTTNNTPSTAKVFVCGIWNSVAKSKSARSHTNASAATIDSKETLQEDVTPGKPSSSKARRLRKMKHKDANEEETRMLVDCAKNESIEVEDKTVSETNVEANIIAATVYDKKHVHTESTPTHAEVDCKTNITHLNDSVEDGYTFEVMEDRPETNKSKQNSKNNKTKSFSLAQLFSSKHEKSQNLVEDQSNNKIETNVSTENNPKEPNEPEVFCETLNTPTVYHNVIQSHLNSTNNTPTNSTHISENTSSPDTDNPAIKSSTVFTITDIGIRHSCIEPSDIKYSSTKSNQLISSRQSTRNNTTDDIGKKESPTRKSEVDSRPISIFVIPPDNIAELEEEEPIEHWESTSDLEDISLVSSNEDVRPGTLIHLPSNDIQTSTVIKDGRNGIIQINDYELSVQDLNTPIIAPEEEAKLRNFLETLNLTKPPEDYADSTSYGDSSSTSMSEHSPVPPPPPTEEIVVYRQISSHSVAESCYIPPRHQRFLDVITEESSDPSDSEKRNSTVMPWECPDIIRKNNEMDSIPNDWFGSDEEPDTTSEEGGIDTSWRDGRKLEDAEGVEVVFLSSSSGDEDTLKNHYNDDFDTSLSNRAILSELVMIHAMENENVKSTVQFPCFMLQKEDPAVKVDVEDYNIKTHSIDEIVEMLNCTMETNLFAKHSPVKRLIDDICSDNTTSESYINNVKKNDCTCPAPECMKKSSNTESSFNLISSEILTYDDISLKKTTESSNEQPPPVAAVTPQALSRRGSSSSGTSQSTAKYNPGLSPTSSENDDKIDKEQHNEKRKTCRKYNPKSLMSLSKDTVTKLPHGEFMLRNIVLDTTELGEETTVNESVKTLPPSAVSTRRSSAHELETIFSIHQGNNIIPFFTPVLISTSSELPPLPVNEDPWTGVPTSTDPTLLVCLSPSQSRVGTLTSPKEASELLDLHKKFLERRGYHESGNSTCPRERCPSIDSSYDVITIEPCESNRELARTPELLTEAANLLALKEYRKSRFKKVSQPKSEETLQPLSGAVSNDAGVSEENGGLSGVTSRGAEIAVDSAGHYSNRSAGTSRLLALLQCSTAPHNSTVPSEMDRADKGTAANSTRGSYLSEWLPNSEHVSCATATSTSLKPESFETVVNSRSVSSGNIEKSNSEVTIGFREFQADKYKISKRGDIAIIQSEKPPVCGRKERPKSVPTAGIPALSPSGEDVFRDQMYHEYMNKVAERIERRQQKLIRISKLAVTASSRPEPELVKTVQTVFAANELESEFMDKVRERMSKLGIALDEERSTEGDCSRTETIEPIPKHLQEFMEFTTPVDAPGDGVWSPGATPEPQRKEFNFSSDSVKEQISPSDSEQTPPVWTPKSAAASPTLERKAFRPVNFDSPKLSRRTLNNEPVEEPNPPKDLPLSVDSPSHDSLSSSSVPLSSSQTSAQTTTQTTTHQVSGRSLTSHSLPDTSLPRAQNPTITLLQKAREGQLPKGALYLDQELNNNSHSASQQSVVETFRREYESETEDKRPKKIELIPKKYVGIGPVTKEGIPTVLRSEVEDENQQKWYKRMYDSLHKAESDSRYPYTSAAGYLSEPEPLAGYDSDYKSAKYATLDRRRIRNKETDFTTSTMPRAKYSAIKHGVDVYKNQPGRIEDYEPGHSSIAEKETKQWWDEVMDIFNGQLEQTQKSPSRIQASAASSSSHKPFMTYALKESGYESDSTLVFKRRDETQQELSPAEQKLAYKVIQKGGDVPLHGLRKPVPEKPKEPSRTRVPVPQRESYPPQRHRAESPHRYVESEVTIHYRSPVCSEEKQAWSEDELRRRQAEAMRRIYQEERRRKYLQELQDMYSRRHTDNFTPSQKSPIPLNRYDDFVDDLSPGKPRDRTPEPKLVARALYNFVGQSSRELTFRRGDIIYVRRQIDKNWYEGEHNAMIGLFPFNYVEIIPYDGIRTLPKRPTEGQARAKFNFQAQTHLELPLVKGELVLLTRRVDNNWFEGRIGNRKGIFPVSYVDVLVEPGERAMSPARVSTPTKPVASPAAHSLQLGNDMSQHHYQPPRPLSYSSLTRQKTAELQQPPVNETLHIDTQNEPVPYRVLYNYKPQNEDELELVEGETVYVMEKCDDGWYVGSSQQTGCLGTFPGNYVQREL